MDAKYSIRLGPSIIHGVAVGERAQPSQNMLREQYPSRTGNVHKTLIRYSEFHAYDHQAGHDKRQRYQINTQRAMNWHEGVTCLSRDVGINSSKVLRVPGKGARARWLVQLCHVPGCCKFMFHWRDWIGGICVVALRLRKFSCWALYLDVDCSVSLNYAPSCWALSAQSGYGP